MWAMCNNRQNVINLNMKVDKDLYLSFLNIELREKYLTSVENIAIQVVGQTQVISRDVS